MQIDRQDRMRQVTVMGNLEQTKPLGAALQDVRQIESEIGLPARRHLGVHRSR